MDPRQSRRMAAIAIFLGCFFFTTWLDATFSQEESLTYIGNSRSKRSTVDSLKKEELQELMQKSKVKSDVEYQQMRDKIAKQYHVEEKPENVEKPGPKNSKPLPPTPALSDPQEREDMEEEEDDLAGMEEFYSRLLEERAMEIRKKVYRCLPKFICEVHSQTDDKITTDLEREWLAMYSNPGMLTDSVHEFQVAAHMGQLFKGYQPSPCHQLYTNCPITMTQLKKFMGTFSLRKHRF